MYPAIDIAYTSGALLGFAGGGLSLAWQSIAHW